MGTTRSEGSDAGPPPATKGNAREAFTEEENVTCLDKVSKATTNAVESAFEKLTRVTTSYPKSMIAATVLLSVVLAQGVHFFEEETDGSKLFAPRGSRAVEEEDYVLAVFGNPAETADVFIAAHSDNLLTAAGMQTLFKYYTEVATEVTGTFSNGTKFGWPYICYKFPSELTPGGAACKKTRSPLQLWNYDPLVIGNLTDARVIQDVNDEKLWRSVEPTGPPVRHYISETGIKEENGRVVGAKAMRLNLELKNDKKDDESKDPETEDFELALVKHLVDSFQPYASKLGYAVEVQTGAEEDEAGDEAMNNDFGVLVIGYVLMIVFTLFVMCRARPKYSHMVVALASVMSVGMATISAYGLCWFMGLKFNAVTQVLILVLLGIGIDDTFVIMDSWWDNAHIVDMRERMLAAVSHAGPAITITSFTDLIAFLAGSATQLPAIKTFCYYAAIGIFFDFAYQITFVVAIAYLDSLRQEKGRRDLFCCATAGDHDGWVGQLCIKTHEPKPKSPAAAGEEGAASADSPKVTKHSPDSEEARSEYEIEQEAITYQESDRGVLHYVVGEIIPRFILGNWIGKTVVLLITAVFLTFGIIGCTQVNMNFNHEWFVSSSHRFADVLEMRDLYFEGRSIPTGLYTKQVDYPTYDTQVLLEDQMAAMDTNRWVVEGSTSSWLRALVEHVNRTQPALLDTTTRAGYTLIKPEHFYPSLQAFRRTQRGLEYNTDFAWTDTTNSVLAASRMFFLIKPGPLTDGQLAIDCIDELRDALDKFGSFPWSFVFIFWESYKVFFTEITRNVGIAGACVFVLVTILSANPFIAFYVILSLGCVDVCLIGYMPWIGVELNSVSVVCIVLAIGLAVDYSVHIACAFLTVKGTGTEEHSSRAQRAAFALWKMGAAVMNGGFSTFLAVLPLVFAQSYVFKVFFRMFFLIIFFGLWFGVLVVPIVLSLAGPRANPGANDLLKQPWTNPLCAEFATAEPVPVHVEKEMDAVSGPEEAV